MNFYEGLKQGPKKEEPTYNEIIMQNYDSHVKGLLEAVKRECTRLSNSGKHSLSLCSLLRLDEDFNRPCILLQSLLPDFIEKELHNNWSRQFSHYKKDYGPNDDNKVKLHVINKWFGFPLDKTLRNRLVQDLQRLLTAEGFPANCVKPLDYSITIPSAYSFFTGKVTAYESVGIRYFFTVSISW